jgi:dethiobiotin synthetase
MAKRIFITATNTDIGKTHATKLLLCAYAKMGYKVAAFKPIETGVVSEPEDGSALLSLIQELNPLTHALHVSDIVPIQFQLPAAPYVASGAQCIDKDKLLKALEKLESLCDIIIIEGAGGLYVPVDKTTMMIDLIRFFEAKALLVTHCKLGCINDTLLSIKALEMNNISYEWALNCKDDKGGFKRVSLPYFSDTFDTVYSINDTLDEVAKKLIT